MDKSAELAQAMATGIMRLIKAAREAPELSLEEMEPVILEACQKQISSLVEEMKKAAFDGQDEMIETLARAFEPSMRHLSGPEIASIMRTTLRELQKADALPD
jgi:2-iminoacetate synthase ThiH